MPGAAQPSPGIHGFFLHAETKTWMPACAGMTTEGEQATEITERNCPGFLAPGMTNERIAPGDQYGDSASRRMSAFLLVNLFWMTMPVEVAPLP